MGSRIRTLGRWLRRTVAVLMGAVLLAIVAVVLAGYVALRGHSLPLLRHLATHFGVLLSGQRMEHLGLTVRALPAEGRLQASAKIEVRSLAADRRWFYFLLNDGLRVHRATVLAAPGLPRAAPVYQLGTLLVVDAGGPVAADATVHFHIDYAGKPSSGPFGAASNVLNPERIAVDAEAFWYPTDAQGFFTADVTALVPASMAVAHNGALGIEIERGNARQVHWRLDRPVPGLGLFAGPYTLHTHEDDGTTYRVFRPRGESLDWSRLLALTARARSILAERYGPSGFTSVSLVVSADLPRAFNDGSGVIGLPLYALRAGDYGFGAIAREIAHNWWGNTVTENWFAPGTGGAWLVAGMAEFSSLVAAQAEYGEEALTRRLADTFFDPRDHESLAQMSVFDRWVGNAAQHQRVCRKGAYVSAMLRSILGDEALFRGLRSLLEQRRYQAVTERQLQQALQDESGQDLQRYFDDWVRSERTADLALESEQPQEMIVKNLGPAAIEGDIALWIFSSDAAPVRHTVHVGDHVALPSGATHAILDPQLAWADMQRENNRYPRRRDPVFVAASPQGDVVVTEGDGWPWTPATVYTTTADGSRLHTWDFANGLTDAPVWAPDAGRVLVGITTPKPPSPTIVALTRDGSRHTVGSGARPAAAGNGAVYAVAGGSITRVHADRSEVLVRARGGELLDQPSPSPDGSQLAFTSARGAHLELRVVALPAADERLLLSGDGDRLLYRWSPNGERLYAVLGGSWDWRLWEIHLTGHTARVLAGGAAAITDLAPSPDGTRLAFSAAPELDYPRNRRQVYVLSLADSTVAGTDITDADAESLVWSGADSLVVITASAAAGEPWVVPPMRVLRRFHVADGRIEEPS